MPVSGNTVVVMISRISLLFLSFATMCLAFQRKAMFPLVNAKQMRFILRFSPPKESDNEIPVGKLEKLQVADASLNSLLENMPIAEKYSLLLQSYATNIIDNSNRTAAALDTMDLLFTEMLSKSIAPSEKSSKLLIDASSTFCSSIKLGKSLQLAKAGGNCKAFGAANGLLGVPVTVASSSTLSIDSAVPYDDREQEVLYAGLVTAITASWISLEIGQTFVNELHPWCTLFGVAAVALCGLDVAIRQGKGIKLASAGLERLVLKDAERETHSDGAAFLVGYLLGLPCFCFRPDVTEALKMLRDDPQGLDFYRQPKALGLTAAGKGGAVKSGNAGMFQGMFNKGSKVPDTVISANYEGDNKIMYTLPSIPSRAGENWGEEVQGLSRVLVWLMAPVAAEYLKYGRTVVSDPRRSQKLLSVLEKIQMADKNGVELEVEGLVEGRSKEMKNKNSKSAVTIEEVSYQIPFEEEDKKAFLQWAFYEATSLVKQYGDLLEDVNSYLATGTSTVGECVMLLEDELR